MDESTKQALEDFSNYLATHIQTRKELKSAQVGKYSVNNFRVTFDVYVDQKPHPVYFDLREIKENKEHFQHLISSAVDQLITDIQIKSS